MVFRHFHHKNLTIIELDRAAKAAKAYKGGETKHLKAASVQIITDYRLLLGKYGLTKTEFEVD